MVEIDHQGVEVGRVRIGRGDINRERAALFGAVIALQLAALGSHQGRFPAGFLHGVPRAGQLHLLHAVGQQKSDFLTGNIVS